MIRTHNAQSHGIYINNEVANRPTGTATTFFENISIDHNTIVSGDGFGISVGADPRAGHH